MATKATTNGKGTNRVKEALTNPKAGGKVIEIPEIEIATCAIQVVGTTPLLVHNFSEKSIRQMEDAQKGAKKTTKTKEARDPDADYFGAMYIIEGDAKKDQPDPKKPISSKKAKAIHCVPAAGFRKAMIRGAKMAGAVMTDTRTSFHIVGHNGTNMVPLEFDAVSMDRTIVRLPNKSADIRYRPLYEGWRCKVTIEYNTALIQVGQLVNLLRQAGFGVGICEWRPEKDGDHGMFSVPSGEDAVEELGTVTF